MAEEKANRTVVTSFTQEGFDLYGRNFLKTFHEHWPSTVRLVVYFEGGFLPARSGREEFRPISEVAGHDAFMGALKFPLMRGRLKDKYSINWDAGMCRKSLIHAHSRVFGGKVFWIDADVITHSPVPESFLDEVLPDGKLCCYLGRDYMYTESGFMGFDTAHPHYSQFMQQLESALFSGVFLTLKGWHDCYLFDFVREHFPDRDFLNLAEGIPKHRGVHPFVNSALGKYMDHKKGKRKLSGRSSKNDLIQPRIEPYWNT